MSEKKFSFDIKGVNVAIGMPAYRGVIPVDLMNSILEVFMSKLTGMAMITERENAIISHARNKIVNRFLNETKFQKLLFIDDDMIFNKEDFERILCWSTKYPIVCGAYPMRDYPITFPIKMDEPPIMNEHGLVKIYGTGMGFTIIDRSVFEKLDAVTEDYNFRGNILKGYFNMEYKDGEFFGEDIYFFKKWVAQGGEIWMDPLIKLGHFGNHVYEGNFAELISQKLLEGSNGN